MRNIFYLLVFIMTFNSCNSPYTPKPAGYPKIIFPEHVYKWYEPANCPYKFEYPVYSEILRDTSFFGEPTENPCWATIHFPELNASVYLSYKEIQSADDIAKLENDAHLLTYKHTIKAEYIDEGKLSAAPDVKGLMYEVGGNAASALQFYLTDSVKNFIRGSLYFNSAPNVDSLGIAIDFIKQDIYRMIKSFRWTNKMENTTSAAKKP